MGDYRAIATVTATLRTMLQDLAQLVVPGALVETGPPVAHPEDASRPVVRIFLYAIEPNASFRNVAQPVRRADGTYQNTPMLPLNLHYLLSFFGDDRQLTQHILLGAVLTFLETQPVPLPRDLLSAEQASADNGADLRNSLPGEEIDLVQFVLEPLRHEELSRLWTIFSQVPYALSVAYRCAVVLLQPSVQPEPALPVTTASVLPAAQLPPTLRAIDPAEAEYQAGLTVTLRGSRIGQNGAHVRFGDLEVPAQASDIDTLSVTLPAAIPPGGCFVSVMLPPAGPDQAAATSNAVPFVTIPRIIEPIAVDRGSWFGGSGARATVTVQPQVAVGQRPRLLLNAAGTATGQPRPSYRLDLPVLTAAAAQLRFDLRRVASGRYLARLEVGQATSRLTTGTDPATPDFGRFSGPVVVVP
jgi:hypothetical protein